MPTTCGSAASGCKGADPSAAPEGSPPSTGISIHSSLNVEIDNNEISGWHIAAIRVHDPRHRLHRLNGRGAVRIRENYLHHNQRLRRRVRGGGLRGSLRAGREERLQRQPPRHRRQWAARNRLLLLSERRGQHGRPPLGGRHHDADASDRRARHRGLLGRPKYCGAAGEYFDVRHNGILYTDGTALKIRGTPTQRMDVAYNSFRHSDVWGNFWVGPLDYGAMEQTDGEGGIHHGATPSAPGASPAPSASATSTATA